jgi:hypothetical protein
MDRTSFVPELSYEGCVSVRTFLVSVKASPARKQTLWTLLLEDLLEPSDKKYVLSRVPNLNANIEVLSEWLVGCATVTV